MATLPQPRLLARFRLFARTAGAALVLLACLVLAGWAFDADTLKSGTPGRPNRMAPNTAVAFVLVGLSLLLLDARGRRGALAGQAAALAAALVAGLAVVGYAYSALARAGVERYIPMAPNTAVALLLTSAAALCARPDRGLMAVVAGGGAGGVMARRLLPAAVLIPPALGWGCWLAQRQGAI